VPSLELAAKRATRTLGCIKQHNRLAERGDYPSVFSIGVASRSVLCAVLGPTTEEACEGTHMRPE